MKLTEWSFLVVALLVANSQTISAWFVHEQISLVHEIITRVEYKINNEKNKQTNLGKLMKIREEEKSGLVKS